jgi:hypothetical protein
MVASLTAAAGVNAGGLRVGKPEFRYEANVDIASLADDYYSFRAEAARAPSEVRYVVGDIARDCRFLAMAFRAEARIAARYVASRLGNGTDLEQEASAVHHR